VSTPPAARVRAAFGEGPLVSDWVQVTQEAMDGFADATRDHDWMHLDPERAREAGLGGTIAFGFWTLSMLSHFLRDALGSEYPAEAEYGFNYGLDRVRFLAPVPVGSRIRNRLTVEEVRDKGGGRCLVRTRNEVELEGADGPAMVAVWLIELFFPPHESEDAPSGPTDTRGAT